MLSKLKDFICRCGEPMDIGEEWCMSCENHYEGKYDSVADYAIRGYKDGLIEIEDGEGNRKWVTQEEYQKLEDEDKVWYSFKGVADIR